MFLGNKKNVTNDDTVYRGADFRNEIAAILDELQSQGIIKKLSLRVRYKEQFYAPMVAYLPNVDVVFFSTTTVRSDRLKEQQWDSWGIKENAGRPTKCVVIIPQHLSVKEEDRANVEIERLSQHGYISKIDIILRPAQLQKYLINLK